MSTKYDPFMGYHGSYAKLSAPSQKWYVCTSVGCRKRCKSKAGLAAHERAEHANESPLPTPHKHDLLKQLAAFNNSGVNDTDALPTARKRTRP